MWLRLPLRRRRCSNNWTESTTSDRTLKGQTTWKVRNELWPTSWPRNTMLLNCWVRFLRAQNYIASKWNNSRNCQRCGQGPSWPSKSSECSVWARISTFRRLSMTVSSNMIRGLMMPNEKCYTNDLLTSPSMRIWTSWKSMLRFLQLPWFNNPKTLATGSNLPRKTSPSISHKW